MSFQVDGYTWDIPCKIVREAELTASDVSGMLLDKTYFNDVLGTYMRYTITVAVPRGQMDDYTDLYDILVDPVDAHEFVLPYNNVDITITAKVDVVSDEFVRLPGDRRYWRNTTFTATAVHPTKTYTLGEAISRGLAPLPDEAGVDVGQTYMYTEDGWEPYEYELADLISY